MIKADVAQLIKLIAESDLYLKCRVNPYESFGQFLSENLFNTDGYEEIQLQMKEFLDSVKQEVSDTDGRYYKKPTKTITHKYSELAAILIRFKVIGQPDYSNQFISFGYTDDQVEKYAKIDDMEAAKLVGRWDI